MFQIYMYDVNRSVAWLVKDNGIDSQIILAKIILLVIRNVDQKAFLCPIRFFDLTIDKVLFLKWLLKVTAACWGSNKLVPPCKPVPEIIDRDCVF